VDGFVVIGAFVQVVPQDFEPAVAEFAQGGVVAVAGAIFWSWNSRAQAERDRLQNAHCWTASPRCRL
jgi:hypothetical protein